jgi:hypothetical protein
MNGCGAQNGKGVHRYTSPSPTVIPTKVESPAAGGTRVDRDQIPASPGHSSFLGMTVGDTDTILLTTLDMNACRYSCDTIIV